MFQRKVEIWRCSQNDREMRNYSLPKGDKKKSKEIAVLLRALEVLKTPGQVTSAVITNKQEQKAATLKERHGRKGITYCTRGDE